MKTNEEQTMTIQICPEGDLIAIYCDPMKIMIDLGRTVIKRASHVEPNNAGLWTADMAPVGGPVLGPYETREEALLAEVAWIQDSMSESCNPFKFMAASEN